MSQTLLYSQVLSNKVKLLYDEDRSRGDYAEIVVISDEGESPLCRISTDDMVNAKNFFDLVVQFAVACKQRAAAKSNIVGAQMASLPPVPGP